MKITGVKLKMFGLTRVSKALRASLPWLIAGSLFSAFANAQAPTIEDYELTPPLSEYHSVTPMVMLAISGDHQLFMKAYNDYDSLDGDDIPEVTYSHNFEYTGYFDAGRCYTYNGADPKMRGDTAAYFVPAGLASNTAGGTTYPVRQFCASNEWSGNFLNWATMTRMDIVRYVLYGGKRSVDTTTQTILERAYLPNDAHSFAKYYDGPFLAQLANFTGIGNYREKGDGCTTGTPEEQAECKKNWGVTFCSTTTGQTDIPNEFSQNAAIRALKPKMRIALGNYSLWATGERYQCLVGSPGGERSPNGVDKREWDDYQDGYKFARNENNPLITGIYAHQSPPTLEANSDWKGDYNVNVEVCDLASDEDDENYDHICKRYPGGSIKPIGILQLNGENTANPTRFGLMTRSFNDNKTGGILRSNIGPISDEVNSNTGQFIIGNESIVETLDKMRIVDYQTTGGGQQLPSYDDGFYRFGSYNSYCRANSSEFSVTPSNAVTNADVACKNWGNPFSEVMAETYKYMSAGTASNVVSDAGLLGLSGTVTWIDPLTTLPDGSDTSCVNFNVVGFNASAVSFDNDLGGTFASLGIGDSTETLENWTNRVAELELDTTTRYFLGNSEASAADDSLCTPKLLGIDGGLPNLFGADGTCPEAPRQQGSYSVAGLAYHARTHDLRPDVVNKVFTTKTFGITLAGATPAITIPVNNGADEIKIIPACRNFGHPDVRADDSFNGPDKGKGLRDLGRCALVDFRPIVDDPSQIPTKYSVVWEDSEQGSDYDEDMNGIISYSISGNTLTVTTNVFSESTASLLGFGYVISGVDADGVYFTSWINALPGGGNPSLGLAEVIYSDQPQFVPNNSEATKTFNIPTTAPATATEFLKAPLYYAAKWGSFDDVNGDNTYDAGIDEVPMDENGEPENYALVRQPSKLRSAVAKILKNVTNGAKTRTSPAVAASTVSGQGLALQSLYSPEYRGVKWTGFLNGLFVDEKGYYREDSNNNDTLDATDAIVIFNVSDKDKQTLQFNRYSVGNDGHPVTATPLAVNQDINSLNPLWSAHDQLMRMSSANLDTQPVPYDVLAVNNRRFIFAGVDGSGNAGTAFNDKIESNEMQPFTKTLVAETQFNIEGMLGYDYANPSDTVKVNALIDYVRGIDSPGLRSRSLIPPGELNEFTWRLGDIVNSTPVIVGAPNSHYDFQYDDETYAIYRQRKANRRNMVYVGANDGMLHAFNAGFYDAETGTYNTAQDPQNPNNSDPELGAEMWAYVPYNALPHLRWLADPNYSHLYYVDSEVKVFDVNFGDDNSADCSGTHPCGWGTILVVGMRFGGKDVAVDPNGNGSLGNTLRSSYVVMDITNPEAGPKLLGEFQNGDLGYAMGAVELLKFREQNANSGTFSDPALNEWYLVFGSGPQGADAYEKGVSDTIPRLFVLDLAQANGGVVNIDIVAADGSDNTLTTISSVVGEDAYVGGISVADWNDDYKDDMIYFGLVGSASVDDPMVEPNRGDGFLGALMHAQLDSAGLSLISNVGNLLDYNEGGQTPSLVTNLNFSNKPMLVKDRFNTYWVYAGAGKFLTKDDLDTKYANAYFGLRVNNPNYIYGDAMTGEPWLVGESISKADLFDSRSASYDMYVSDTNAAYVKSGLDITPLYQFVQELYDPQANSVKKGWFIPFDFSVGENNFNNSAFTYNTIIFNTYLPDVDNCYQAGRSNLYLMDMFTGLPSPHIYGVGLSNTTTTSNGETLTELNPGPIVGNPGPPPVAPVVDQLGRLAMPMANNKPDCDDRAEKCGSPINTRGGNVSWREISLDELQ